MTLFSTNLHWTHTVEGPVDPSAVAVANMMRTRANSAQIVVGSLTGRITVLRTENSESESVTNEIMAVETHMPILGLEVGSFSGLSSLLDDQIEAVENVDLAVVHPQSIAVYTPKRMQNGDISLDLLTTLTFSRQIVSFCVITTYENTSEAGVKLYSSKLAVRTEDGYLHLCARKLLSSHRLGLIYSLPTPMIYCSSIDALVIASFDYTVASFSCADLSNDVQREDNGDASFNTATLSPHPFDAEGNPLCKASTLSELSASNYTGPSCLVPQWTYVAGERVQQLAHGRFFGADSSAEGEILILHAHGVTLVSATSGMLSTGMQISDVLSVGLALFPAIPQQIQSNDGSTGTSIRRKRRTTLPEVASFIVLDANSIVHVFHRGELRWVSRLCQDLEYPASIRTPSCLARSFTICQPPKLCGQSGLFVTLSRTGSIQVHLFGTRALQMGVQDSEAFQSLLNPIYIPKQAVAKVAMEDVQKQLVVLKVQRKDGIAQSMSDVLSLKCEINGFYQENGIYYSIVSLTVRDLSKKVAQVTLNVLGCGDQEHPIVDAAVLGSYKLPQSNDKATAIRLSSGPVSSLINLGDNDGTSTNYSFQPTTMATLRFNSSGVATAQIKLGVSCLSFFSAVSLSISLSTSVKTASEGNIIVTPFVSTRNLFLPLFANATISRNAKLIAPGSEWPSISFVIVAKDTEQPFTTLHELLSKRQFSASILAEISQQSPNSVCIRAGLRGRIILSMSNDAVTVAASALEYVPIGIEFLLGYRGYMRIRDVAYNKDILLDRLADIYVDVLVADKALMQINTGLVVLSELLSSIFQTLADKIPRIPMTTTPFDMDFSNYLAKYSSDPEYSAICGDLSFLMNPTFISEQSMLGPARSMNIGDKLDALLAYYELQLHEAQRLTNCSKVALQRLRAGMSVFVSIIGVNYIMREKAVPETFEYLRQCLSDFENVAHLLYFISCFSANSSADSKITQVFNSSSSVTPDQLKSSLQTLLANSIVQ